MAEPTLIEQLRIKNLGVIDSATLEFAPGFNVLTGETGTGKTMVFRSLGLLLGGRSDANLVTTGASQAQVEADFVVDSLVSEQVDELGGQTDDGLLICARTIATTGRGRAFVGGASVPTGALAEITESLVTVHGQNEQLRLANASTQLAVLDKFAGAKHLANLADYQNLWAKRVAVGNELAELTGDVSQREAKRAFLSEIFEKLDHLAPEPGEDIALDQEARRLIHAQVLGQAVTSALVALDGDDVADDFVESLLRSAKRALEHERNTDEVLGEFADRISTIESLVADLVADIHSYRDAIDASPARLEFVETRRAALKSLRREHASLDDFLAWAQDARALFETLSGGQERIEELEAEFTALSAELKAMATKITKSRQVAADAFSTQVSVELVELAMPGAQVSFQIEPAELSPTGADRVGLGLSARAGAPWIALGKGASGGELSRIMLAVQVVLAGNDPTGTFVFDEVDAGIGGQAAVEVGRRLAKLAQSAQVIVVTHLPQVAAFATNHLVVSRTGAGSQIVAVSEQERTAEIARMLAGEAGGEKGLDLAEQLLASARV